MSNITLCWELGAGYGHIAGFQALSHALIKNNHTVTALLRNTDNAATFLDSTKLKIDKAPHWHSQKKHHALTKNAPTISYADILQRLGYDSFENLLSLVEQWRNKFIGDRTELIIADYSPTALLAARTLDIPSTDYGTGFSSPPAINPLPTLTPWLKPDPEFLKKIEDNVLSVINTVLRHYSKDELNYFYELFEIEENFLCTFPELDHYQGRSADVYWGPRFSDNMGIPVRWPDNNKPNIFLYTKSSYQLLDKLLLSLRPLDANILVHCSGISDDKIENYSAVNITFSKSPIQIKSLARTTDLVINNAGHGVVSASLLLGLTQLLLPMQLEQSLLAYKLKSLQLCEMIPKGNQSANYAEIIQSTIENKNIQTRTEMFKQYYHGFNQEEQIEEIVFCCEDILANKKGA